MLYDQKYLKFFILITFLYKRIGDYNLFHLPLPKSGGYSHPIPTLTDTPQTDIISFGLEERPTKSQ